MAKSVSLSDEAYEKLNSIRNGKSFSELIIELAREIDKDSYENENK